MARYSRQRELILNVVKNNLIHPSADEIYHIAKAQDQTISLGTVYRNLSFLSECGEILKVPVNNGADRYDGNIMEHNHIICKKCGKICDYTYDFSDLKNNVFQQTNIQCEHVSVALEGLCENCSKKTNN